MRQPRLKAPDHFPVAYYHCISRVVDRQFVLGEEEKEQFLKYMRLYEDFCGVRVVTHCIMSNHFHILLEVPQRPEEGLSDDAFLAKLKRVYTGFGYGTIEQKLQMFREAGPSSAADAQAYRETFLCRMWDVSAFMKLLKQRFTQWYNRQKGRKGTLWEERFKSVLVQDTGEALVTMAAYIDLNPLRAGMVADPKDYRWCGYAEAAAGRRRAKAGLKVALDARAEVHGPKEEGRGMKEKVVVEEYRVLLFGRGDERGLDEHGAPVRRGVSREKIAEVLANKGRLTRLEMLRCKVRYFADGAVLGTKEFVNTIFTAERHRYGPNRKSGARPIRQADAGGLTTMRDLRVEPIS